MLLDFSFHGRMVIESLKPEPLDCWCPSCLIISSCQHLRPLLEKRAQVLAAGDDKTTGTPAVKGFWLQALNNHPAMEGEIEKHDRPILEYLKDITCTALVENDEDKGFKLHFL